MPASIVYLMPIATEVLVGTNIRQIELVDKLLVGNPVVEPTTIPMLPILLVLAILIPLMVMFFKK